MSFEDKIKISENPVSHELILKLLEYMVNLEKDI